MDGFLDQKSNINAMDKGPGMAGCIYYGKMYKYMYSLDETEHCLPFRDGRFLLLAPCCLAFKAFFECKGSDYMIWVNYIQLANLEKYNMSNMGTNISPPSRHF